MKQEHKSEVKIHVCETLEVESDYKSTSRSWNNERSESRGMWKEALI